MWRVTKNEQDNKDNSLYDLVKVNYPRAFQCTMRVKKFIEETYDYHLSKDECTYLTVHIQKLLDV
ncbi:PRD domain-containing protein [Jeotgalibaca sp. MA1X17-3]|uniref:PRD domain-containing protein n=1 Tax=Jeotgalibaca sp. MA1X17-3 TaxID=2908211 RepID=UPI0037BFAFC6